MEIKIKKNYSDPKGRTEILANLNCPEDKQLYLSEKETNVKNFYFLCKNGRFEFLNEEFVYFSNFSCRSKDRTDTIAMILILVICFAFVSCFASVIVDL
ncbi:hypothetical protein MHBO_000195 [Bonamia ostreae]|uniref:Uncharacterized protein n=1 Tax=Bonamia ostreae TaxID=126728 RepID=A0ABV2AEQ5_9EUKA